jgi:Zn-dependent protease
MGYQDRRYFNRSSGGRYGGGSDLGGSLLRALNYSFPIGVFLGIRVRVHITFIILVAGELLFRDDRMWTIRWTALLFGSVLLHELGHCLACRRVGGRADDILMWPLGGLAFVDPPKRPWPEFVTVVWGPLVNLIIAGACYLGLWLWLGQNSPVTLNPLQRYAAISIPLNFWAWLIADLFVVNYILLLFNLALVFYPFDGGRIVQIILWKFLGYVRSMRIATSVGMFGAVVAAVLGLVWNQFTLVIIAIFGFLTCMQQQQALRNVDDFQFAASLEAGPWSGPQAERRPGMVARWREQRAERARQREIDERRALEQQIDAILDKVHQHGLASLTERERRILQQDTQRKRTG